MFMICLDIFILGAFLKNWHGRRSVLRPHCVLDRYEILFGWKYVSCQQYPCPELLLALSFDWLEIILLKIWFIFILSSGKTSNRDFFEFTNQIIYDAVFIQSNKTIDKDFFFHSLNNQHIIEPFPLKNLNQRTSVKCDKKHVLVR